MSDVTEENSGKETEPTGENSGGACNYYRVQIDYPTTLTQVPYIAECNDVMKTLKMDYAESNMFKEIWRSAAERTLGLKKAGHDAVRGADKIEFFSIDNKRSKHIEAGLPDPLAGEIAKTPQVSEPDAPVGVLGPGTPCIGDEFYISFPNKVYTVLGRTGDGALVAKMNGTDQLRSFNFDHRIKMISPQAPKETVAPSSVGEITLALAEVDILDEAVDHWCHSIWMSELSGRERKQREAGSPISVLMYNGTNPTLVMVKELSQRINSLRESLLNQG